MRYETKGDFKWFMGAAVGLIVMSLLFMGISIVAVLYLLS